MKTQFKEIAAQLEADRQDWLPAFKNIANWLFPRPFTWLDEPGKKRQAATENTRIINPFATVAAQRCAAGLTEGVASRTNKWFVLRARGVDLTEDQEAARWLYTVEATLRYIFSSSNFYQAFGQAILNLVAFGNGAVWIDPDPDRVIRAHSIPVGEFAFGIGPNGSVRQFYRTFSMTAKALADRFSRPPAKVREMLEQGGRKALQPVRVFHVVTEEGQAYWCEHNTKETYLEETKADGPWPVSTFRWDVVGYDTYGVGPGHTAVRLVKALQHAELVKQKLLDALDKPPLQADAVLQSSGVSLIPGGVTYVHGLNSGAAAGVRPIMQIDPNAVLMAERDIDRIQRALEQIFFLDLFMIISSLDTVRTATEIAARKAEKVAMLGPVLQRIEDEALSPAIIRTFDLAQSAGLIPEPPASLRGADVDIQYISMLHQAQEASDTVALERGLATLGNLAGVMPQVLQRINPDETVLTYFEKLGVDPRVVRTDKEVEEIRQAEAAQQTVQQTVEQAKLLSETDVGGGQNALSMLIGGG